MSAIVEAKELAGEMGDSVDHTHFMRGMLGLAAADGDRWSTFAGQFRDGGSQVSITSLVVLGVVVLVAVIVLWKVARVMALRDGQSYHNPTRLFHDLCRLHGLDFPSRKLLWRLAKIRQLEHPARLFLEPTWFDAAQVPATLQPFRSQLAELKQRLFTAPHSPS